MKIFSFITFFLISLPLLSQIQIKGICFDEQYKGIPFPSILIYADSGNQVVKFVIGDKLGNFSFQIDEHKEKIKVRFSAVSYVDTIVQLSSTNSDTNNFRIILRTSIQVLKEVVVHTDNAIIEKGDTISMKSKYFSDGYETVLEDLLKKMPGLDVTSDGVIRVNGKEIEKIMVEGDDFFDKGYKLLSKNMPPGVVDKVEIIQRYESQKLRKGLKESDKVALNLRLTNEAKRKWFGNIDVNLSPVNTEFYAGRMNLMNFREKLKYYFLTAANSTGNYIDISLIDQVGGINEEIGNENEQNNFLSPSVSLVPNSISLPIKKFSFNQMLLNSGNIILRPFSNTKIRIGINRLSDRVETTQMLVESIALKDTAFITNESYYIRRMPITYLGKLNRQTEIDSTSSLNADIFWLGVNNQEGAATSFNTKPLLEQNTFTQNYFSYKATLSKRISEKKFIQIVFGRTKEELPLEYINQPFLPTIFFGVPSTVNSLQHIQQYRSDNNFNLTYVNKLTQSVILETSVGYKRQRTEQLTTLLFKNKDSIYNTGNDFNGYFSLNLENLYSKISASKKWKSVSFIPSVEILFIRQSSSAININGFTNTFLNPSLTIAYQPNKKHKLLGVMGFSSTAPVFEDVQPTYRMSGFRSFQRGSGNIQPIRQTTNILSYTLGNWADRLFINIFYLGIIGQNFLGTNTIIDPSLIFSEKIWLQNKQTQSLNANADLFVKRLDNNLKLTTQLSSSTFYNVVNRSNIRKIETESLTIGLEAKSVFKGFYNHHFGIKRTVSRNVTEQNRRFIFYTSFFDIHLSLKKLGALKIKNEGYHFPKEQVDRAFLIFTDFNWTKTIIEGKFSVGLSISNLWNQTEFINISLSDVSVTKNSTNLLPRIALIKAEYRF